MKLLLDEQISGSVAERLRKSGHDVLAAAAEPLLRGTSDHDLFAFAQDEGRAVVTYDRGDFEAVARSYTPWDRAHHGLVIVHPSRLPSHQFGRLVKALEQLIEGPELGASFVIWLPTHDDPGGERPRRG